MQVTEVSKLARAKGCALKVMFAGDTFVCWIENSHFVGKPCSSLDELITFLNALPILQVEESELSSLLA